jgi:hypothetical protein
MTNRSNQSGAGTLAHIASDIVGAVGSVFSATLQRIYAAHTEKAQMRFAPQPIYSGRIGRRRRGL